MTTIKVGLMAVCLLMLCSVACGDVDMKQPYVSTDKPEYTCGEVVTITYNFQTAPQKGVTPRISIYQDPELILHVVTWDAHGTTGVQQWKTAGLWDGTYYIVSKHHRSVGLLYDEEVVAVSKFTLVSGAKHQQSLASTIAMMRHDMAGNTVPMLTPFVYNIQKPEVENWLKNVL